MRKSSILSIASIAILLFIFAAPNQYDISGTKAAGQVQHLPAHQAPSASPVIGRMASMHTVDMRKVPPVFLSPAPTGSDSVVHQGGYTTPIGVAPRDIHPHSPPQGYHSSRITTTPPLASSFQGVNESYCPPPPGFCPPPDSAPDMALGVSPNWVLQGVNRWFADYSVLGKLQPGWPKSFQKFFGVPYPGGCTAIPDLFNPRAFYDPNDQRFWAAVLNNETVHGKCTSVLSRAWIAVSQTNNPNGVWNVYSFDEMLGTQNFADFTQFGYDQKAVYLSCDMWTQPSGLGTFEYENTFAFNKAAMEAGQSVTPYGYSGFISQGVQMNGIQPVEVEATRGNGPNAGLFVSPFDFNSGGGNCAQGCSGLTVWAIANPATPQESLSSILVPSLRYAQAPQANQPGCTSCLGVLDPGINSTPTWRNGQINFSLQTAVNNGSKVVPGIFWGQINVSLDSNGNLSSASIYQSGYFSFSGDTAALCPSIMPDANGNLMMVFQESSSTLYPGAYYAVQPVGSPPGIFPDSGQTLMAGQATTINSRWGDYSAVDVNGAGAIAVWIASEYEAANQTWSSYIGKVYTSS